MPAERIGMRDAREIIRLKCSGGNVRVTTGPLRMAQRAPTERRPLGPECVPLGQRTGSSMFINLASDEMTLMIELVVDLSGKTVCPPGG